MLVDAVDGDTAIARSSADAPEIDGVVRIAGGQHLKPGAFARVTVTAADEHDLQRAHGALSAASRAPIRIAPGRT